LLPLYLLELGFSPFQVGIIATATLCGSGLLTLLVGLHAYRYHYRALLLAATILMAGTGLGFALLTDFWPLLMIAIVGTLNPSSGDVSVFLPLEHAVMSRVEWSCASCHTQNPLSVGKHAKTGKDIAPLAPAANAERLTSPDKVEKWFKRNCNDVLGRTCTPQEKGDVLAFLLSLK
jgi:hypothetical protein